MDQKLAITPAQVAEALGKSARFPQGSLQFDMIAPFIGQLVEIVGDRLNDKVDFSGLSKVTAEFTRWLARNDEFKAQLDDLESELLEDLYVNLADQLDSIAENLSAFLAGLDITETQIMEDNVLDGEARELYRQRELDFTTLLLTSPDIFIPKSDD